MSQTKQDLVSALKVSLISGNDRNLLDDRLHEGCGNKGGVGLPDDILGSIQIVARTADEQETLLAISND